MKRCKNCKISVYPQHERCPLCGLPVGTAEDSPTCYPVTVYEVKRQLGLKTFKLFCIVTSVVCVFINIFESQYLWSPIVCAVAAALWVTISSLVSKTISRSAKLLNIFLVFAGAAFVIDLSVGFSKWSTTFVIPFATIGLTAILTVFAIRNRKRYQEYLGYLVAMFFISLCPIFVFLLSLSLYAWTAFAAAIYSVLTVVGFWIFADKGFRNEMKKRFHL